MAENAFEYFLARKNARVVQLLEKNAEVSGMMQALLEHLVEWCDEQRIEFSQVRLIEPHISPDGRYIKAHITKAT